jgi:hypothetical protein
MNYGKTIKIFLPTGKTDEIKIASIANSTVQATLIPRNILSQVNIYQEISSTGIYFLLDSDYNVYIGEAEDVSARIKQHDKDEEKDWWNIVITINVNSLNSPLSKGHIKYLEGFCFNKIKEAERYMLNQTKPAKTGVSREDQAYLMHIYEDLKILVSTFGYLLFDNKRKILKDDEKELEKDKHVFFMNVHNSDASGEYTSEGFLVYKGSKFNNTHPNLNKVKDSRSIKYYESIEKILKSDKFEIFEGYSTLKEDMLFSSPSGAACTVAFRMYDGWHSWKTKDGKTLDEIYRQNKEGSS